MRDLRTVYIRDEVRVVGVTDATLAGVRRFTISVAGGALQTTRVLVNDFDAPFTVLSDTRVLVIAPSEVAQTPLDGLEFSVHSAVFTGTRGVRLTLELGLYTESVSGIEKLIQEVLLDLLASPGSDVFDPARGGGLLAHLGATEGGSSAGDVLSGMLFGVSRVEERIRSRQLISPRVGGIPAAERLASLAVWDSRVDPVAGSLTAWVRLVNGEGVSAMLPLSG